MVAPAFCNIVASPAKGMWHPKGDGRVCSFKNTASFHFKYCLKKLSILSNGITSVRS